MVEGGDEDSEVLPGPPAITGIETVSGYGRRPGSRFCRSSAERCQSLRDWRLLWLLPPQDLQVLRPDTRGPACCAGALVGGGGDPRCLAKQALSRLSTALDAPGRRPL